MSYREADINQHASKQVLTDARYEKDEASQKLEEKKARANHLKDDLAEEMRQIAEDPAPLVGRPRMRRTGTMSSLTDPDSQSDDERGGGAAGEGGDHRWDASGREVEAEAEVARRELTRSLSCSDAM